MITNSSIGSYGRLGNQLFSIASLMGVAIKNNMQYEFHLWYCNYTKKSMEPYFQNALPKISFIDKARAVYREKSFKYEDIKLDQSLNYDLFGYFQSSRYFEHCEKDVRYFFQPAQSVVKALRAKYTFPDGRNLLDNFNTCAIHIRRGDYIGNSVHEVCSMLYYAKAVGVVSTLHKIDKFVIFSDDIEFCKQHLPLFIDNDKLIFIENKLEASGDTIHRENSTDVEELILMSKMKHFVIANSSYSWWGSFLSENKNKTIIAPKRWLLDGTDDSDIYTKDMIRL